MRDIATATLSGNLTREVELKALPSGTDVARLRVATTTRRRTGEEWVEKTNYFTVEVYGAQARSCAQYLRKGSRVFVDAEPDWREWTDQQEKKREAVTFRARQVVFEGGRPAQPQMRRRQAERGRSRAGDDRPRARRREAGERRGRGERRRPAVLTPTESRSATGRSGGAPLERHASARPDPRRSDSSKPSRQGDLHDEPDQRRRATPAAASYPSLEEPGGDCAARDQRTLERERLEACAKGDRRDPAAAALLPELDPRARAAEHAGARAARRQRAGRPQRPGRLAQP